MKFGVIIINELIFYFTGFVKMHIAFLALPAFVVVLHFPPLNLPFFLAILIRHHLVLTFPYLEMRYLHGFHIPLPIFVQSLRLRQFLLQHELLFFLALLLTLLFLSCILQKTLFSYSVDKHILLYTYYNVFPTCLSNRVYSITMKTKIYIYAEMVSN